VSGKDLTLGIDIELQAYGELLMRNKVGSIVMIEPATGEILCMVSSPTYDPALLTGKQFGANYLALERNPYKPLINRAIAGTYPPGSTFKLTQGLVFLQEGIITPDTKYACYGGYPSLGRASWLSRALFARSRSICCHHLLQLLFLLRVEPHVEQSK